MSQRQDRARRAERAPSAAPQPLILQIDPATPLPIKLISDPAPTTTPRRRIFLCVLIIILATGIALVGAYYILPINYPPPIGDLPPLDITVAHPAHVICGDSTDLDLTIRNNGTTPLSGTLTVLFAGSVPAQPLPGNSTTIKIDNLAAEASFTQRISFTPARIWCFFDWRSIELGFQAVIDQQVTRSATTQAIPVAPFPYLRSAVLLFYSIALTTILPLLGTWVTQSLFGGKQQ